jgi:NTE family protein
MMRCRVSALLQRMVFTCLLTSAVCAAQSGNGGDGATAPFRVALPSSLSSLAPYADLRFPTASHPRVGVVFSGGGARGLAQIGVLRALEEAGIRPDFIVGTSIGSIVGGLYAAGYSVDRLVETVRSINWDDLLRLSNQSDRDYLLVDQKPVLDRSLFTLRLDGLRPVLPLSVSNGQRLTNLLNELVLQGVYHATRFDRLRMPFRAVATDLYSGQRVVLDSGNLGEALRASATVPVLYAAVPHDSMALVDGGLRSNIPVDVAREYGCDIVLAVNTTSPPRSRQSIRNPIETLDQVLNVMMSQNNAVQLSLADVVITPAIDDYEASDFSATDSLIARGYRSARAIMPLLLQRVERLRLQQWSDTLAVQLQPLWRTGRADSAALLRELAALLATIDPGDAASSTLVVTPGASPLLRLEKVPRPLLQSVQINGYRMLADTALRDAYRKHLEQPLDGVTLRALCDDVINAYRHRGLSFAHIDTLACDTAAGHVSITVDEGRIHDIRVRGNSRTNEVVVLREFPVQAGDVFRITDLRHGMNNLAGLGLFHRISFDVVEERDNPTVIITVEERPSQMLQFGLLVNDERNAQMDVELRDANFFGTGSSAMLQFFGGQENRRYRGVYATNRLFYTILSFTAQAYYDLRDFNGYEDVSGLEAGRFARGISMRYRRVAYGGAASVGLYAERFGQLSGTLRAERQSLRTIETTTGLTPNLLEEQAIISLAVGTTIDTQDRWPYPLHGLVFTAEYTSAQRGLGSDIAFTRLEASYSQYVSTTNGHWTFHPSIRFGYGDRTMPRFQEFRLGGLPMFYGMRENEFTGRQLFLGNFEIRWLLPVQILFNTYLSARYDLGRTWEVPEQITFRALRHGVGIGLGLDTPLGPADFGVGSSFLLRDPGSSTTITRGPLTLYFSIGVDF